MLPADAGALSGEQGAARLRMSALEGASDLEEEMLVAAEELRFEYAAKLRDEIKDLRRELLAVEATA